MAILPNRQMVSGTPPPSFHGAAQLLRKLSPAEDDLPRTGPAVPLTPSDLRVLQRLECELPVLEELRFASINLRPSAREVRQGPHAIYEALRVVGEVCDCSYILQV